MLGKLAVLAHSKVAAAVVGAVLISGTGAVAVAATQGKIALPGAATSHSSTTHTPNSTPGAIHAHTTAIEGTLVACSGTATGTICVTDARGKTYQITINAETKINGDHALVSSDLSKLLGRHVQVQATTQSDGSLVAWKVTIEGGQDNGSGNGNGGNGNGGNGGGQARHATVSGTVASVGAQSFTLTVAGGGSQMVTVSTATEYEGAVHGFAGLHGGLRITAQGTKQTDGSLAATRIEAE